MAELNPTATVARSLFPPGPMRWLESLTTGWSLFGGLLFCLIVAMSIISIVGRKLLGAPIQGDMELLMMGSAVAAATFLPVCEMYDHHIKVDALTTWMSERGRATLDTVAHALLTLMAVLITWRSTLYAFETHENMEVSTLLLVPIWWPVALLVPSFVLLALAAAARTLMSARDALGLNGGRA